MGECGFALEKFLIPLWTNLYHSRDLKGCGRFQTKIAPAEKMPQALQLPISGKFCLLANSLYWAKELVKVCRQCTRYQPPRFKPGEEITGSSFTNIKVFH